jgi:formiminotetrahydrofolate cyclodeaminase
MPDQTQPTTITDRTIGDYLATLGSSAPTPGGGSAAGVIGALGAGLGQMVLAFTDLEGNAAGESLRQADLTLSELGERFTALSRQDEEAYAGYLRATSLPRDTPEAKSDRRVAMQEALKGAADIPMAIAEASVELAEALVPVAAFGNRYLKSDAHVAAIAASACFAASRVLLEGNLGLIKDTAWVDAATDRIDALAQRLITATVSYDADGSTP